MIKEIEAVYERGIIRPVNPLELTEGSRIDIIFITREEPGPPGNAASILAEIAALPPEGAADGFSGREHDSVLYPEPEA